MIQSNKQPYDMYGALGESLLQLEDVADKIFTSITDRVSCPSSYEFDMFATTFNDVWWDVKLELA